MDWMYLFYFLLAGLIFWGARYAGRGEWNEDYTSLKQTKILQGVAALGIALHHMSQKTCAPWHPSAFIVHGMDPFIPMGYMLVGVFLFCSGLGLYKSFKSKPGYLKGFFRRRILPVVILIVTCVLGLLYAVGYDGMLSIEPHSSTWQGDMGETWGMKIEKGVLFCDTFKTFLFDSMLYVISADVSPQENQRCEHRM